MIKQVSVDRLKSGMYIHDLNCGWMAHPFLTSRFRLSSPREIEEIRSAGIRSLYIDTDRGLDDGEAPTAQEVEDELTAALQEDLVAQEAQPLYVTEEFQRAKEVYHRAHAAIRDVMRDVRLGKAVEIEKIEPVVQEITESVMRNSGAFVVLASIKNKDDYTFLHSISVCALMVAFARYLNLSDREVKLAGVGGLLHDTGKMLVPDTILNKPARLSDAEYQIIKAHPVNGYDILKVVDGLDAKSLDIVLHHHERADGNGYPHGLKGDQIHRLTSMSAIVDVYDALTANRAYRDAIPPTQALRKMYEWGRDHFDAGLVQSFIHCIGIYPIGSMVRLDSGRVGVVAEQNPANSLMPVVKVFYNLHTQERLQPELVDLSTGADHVVGHENHHRWGLDTTRVLMA